MKKVVFTGGPSSGKTKVANWLKEKYPQQTILLPEAATILYKGGFPRYDDKYSKKLQQKAIFEVQKSMEEIESKIHSDQIILCDRGTLDGLAYWKDGDEDFFNTMDTNLKNELESYDVCFFMQSPSEKDYERFSIRNENYNQALDLEQKLYSVWSEHPHFHYISRRESLLEKFKSVEKIFSNLINKS